MVDLNYQRVSNRALGSSGGMAILEVSKLVAIAAILVVMVLASASIRNQILSLKYDIESLKSENSKLEKTNQLLKVQYNSLVTPAEVEKAATQLGLISANDSQVIILEGDAPAPPENQVAQSRSTQEAVDEDIKSRN